MGDIKIGTGTYIVREDAQRDLAGTLARLEALGYDGAELLGLFGRTPQALREALAGRAIQVMGDHLDIADFLKDPEGEADRRLDAGSAYITLAIGEERAQRDDAEAIIADYRRAVPVCRARGLVPLYHNHAFDMRGESPLAERILDAVPALSFEMDLGWAFVAGQDVARLLRKYRDRLPVVHLKDVFVTDEGFTFRPTGYGNLNTPQYMPLVLACEPQWLVVDHDLAYARDSYDDLRVSLEYVRNMLRYAK